MRAMVLYGGGDLRSETVPDPAPGQAVVRVHAMLDLRVRPPRVPRQAPAAHFSPRAGPRVRRLPDLPPVAETLPGFDVSNWNGIFVPARTPPQIADRLFVEINKALRAPEVKKRQNNSGIEPEGSPSRADFANFLQDDRARWGRIIREAGITVE